MRNSRRRSTLGGTGRLLQWVAALMAIASMAGCGSPSEQAQNQRELLVVYSGDFRGYYEPCG